MSGIDSHQRVALVTGAASGIGLACARRLADGGLRVVLLDRSASVLAIASRFTADGHRVEAVVADLADRTGLRHGVAEVLEKAGRCDVLVNNAGIHPKPSGAIVSLEDTSLEEWEAVFSVNVTAPFLLCQAFAGGMKQRGWGRIVNVVSRAGRTYSDRAGSHYSASKAALMGFTRKIAGEYAAFGVTANCVAPGQIETPLARTSTPEVLARAARATPVGRLGTADEVASAIQYLASEPAGFITGAVLDVNGGIFMG
ncbi:MAG: SDR family NAD(P)-dependent oxidoreductase [Pseudomonadota bacterium]